MLPTPEDQQRIEKEAKAFCNIPLDLVLDEEERYYKDFQKYDGFITGAEYERTLANQQLAKKDKIIDDYEECEKDFKSTLGKLRKELAEQSKLVSDLREALKGIENLCDNTNPAHESIWRIAHGILK